jgi:hypothetical protein
MPAPVIPVHPAMVCAGKNAPLGINEVDVMAANGL